VRKKALDHGAEARFDGFQGAPRRSAELARMNWLLGTDKKTGR